MQHTMEQSLWQRDGPCGANQHNCLDTGHGDQCCYNDSYCYVSSNGESRCCPLGSNCVGDSKCNSESYYCTRTFSATLSASTTGAAANATETGCCGRRCPQPQYYLCPASLGGNCCPFGSECRSDGSCLSSLTSSTTAATTTRGGSSTSGAATGGTPTAKLPDGLSTATKTGIAVTVVAGVAVIAGMVIWLRLLKKRRRTRVMMMQEVSSPAGPAGGSHASAESPGHGDAGDGGGHGDAGEAEDCFGIGVPQAGASRAVPSLPQTPADITSPVEIDSALPSEDDIIHGTPRLETVVSNEVYELDATQDETRAGSSVESVIVVHDEIK